MGKGLLAVSDPQQPGPGVRFPGCVLMGFHSASACTSIDAIELHDMIHGNGNSLATMLGKDLAHWLIIQPC